MTNQETMYCELCGDERVEEDLSAELLCVPCQEREERQCDCCQEEE